MFPSYKVYSLCNPHLFAVIVVAAVITCILPPLLMATTTPPGATNHSSAEELATTDSIVRNVLDTNNISSHVLDIAIGAPAEGIACKFFAYKFLPEFGARMNDNGHWELWGETVTNAQGRIPNVHPDQPLGVGKYKLHFHTKEYFQRQQRQTFFPYIEVVFEIDDPNVHYHVPIILSNFGYSTYKGQ